MNMLIPVVLLLAASCTVPVDGAGAKGRKLPGTNSFLRTGQTLPTGRQGAGMVMLQSNIVVFGGVSGGGACGTAQRESRRGRKRRCALSMLVVSLSFASRRAQRNSGRAESARDVALSPCRR
jgi:hypothetical protein